MNNSRIVFLYSIVKAYNGNSIKNIYFFYFTLTYLFNRNPFKIIWIKINKR